MSAIDYDRLARALLDAGLAREVARHLSAGVLPANENGLLTRDELARALRVSPQTVDRRTRDGMPVEYVGDLPRFDLVACRAWLAARRPRVVAVEEEESLHVTVRTRAK